MGFPLCRLVADVCLAVAHSATLHAAAIAGGRGTSKRYLRSMLSTLEYWALFFVGDAFFATLFPVM